MVTSVPWQLGSAEAREERRRDEPPSDVPAEAEDQEAPAPVVAR
jgi:hypothetical protein